jgi:adenylosuccinate synthase
VLLDRRTGFFPHVTNTDTTFGGATRLLGRPPIRIGVIRAYATRHGAGPFVTEEAALTKDLPDSHNQTNDWQGPIRAGWLDLVALRYAIRASGGVDFLAITNLDRLSGLSAVQAAIDYELPRGGGEFLGRNSSGRRRLRLPRETTTVRQAALTEVLSDCRPVYREFPGWKEPLAEVRALSQLPRPARRFLDFLESENGLGIPVAVVSVGPTAEQKIVLEPFRQ